MYQVKTWKINGLLAMVPLKTFPLENYDEACKRFELENTMPNVAGAVLKRAGINGNKSEIVRIQ